MVKLPDVANLSKLDDRWTPGIWLGKTGESDEHIVGTKTGVMISRTVKEMPKTEVILDLFQQMRWTPTLGYAADRTVARQLIR